MKRKIALIALTAIASVSVAALAGCGDSHTLGKVEAKDPTCVAAGNKEYYKCFDDGCGKIFSDAEGLNEITLESVVVSAKGHSLTGIGVPSDPTCTEDGVTAGEKCSVCGTLVTEQQVVTKKGHKATKVEGKDPTCEDEGTITYYACGVCEKNFIDDECVTEAKEIKIKPTGHAYSEWEAVGTTGKHKKVCANDSSHVETVSCTYGKISDFTDGSGHYLTCNICKGTSEKLPHTLKFFYEGAEHWTECQDCAYVSERAAHSVKELKIDVVGEKLYGGRTITKADLAVESKCECGHKEEVALENVTFEDALLVDGDNALTLVYGEKEYPFTYQAAAEPEYTLTVVGAKFENGYDNVSLKEGENVPAVTPDAKKTFLGYRLGLKIMNDLSAFVMPDSEVTITAVYEEDTVHFAPANKAQQQFSTETYDHVVLDDGTIATRFIWNDETPAMKYPHSGGDTGTHKVNVNSPAHKSSLMFVYVVNNGEKDVDLIYQAENYGVKGEITIRAVAGQTTRVPFVYSSEDSSYTTFSTCDHRLQLAEGSRAEGETVTLDVYGKLVSTENNKLVSILASLPYDQSTFLEEGDTIDLSGLTVTGSISGYNITLYDYECNIEDGTEWTEDITEIVVTHGEFRSVIKLNSYANWIHASFANNVALASPRGDACDWMSAEHITDEETGLPSTRFVVKAGTAANSEVFVNPSSDKGANGNYNTSMPQHKGSSREIRIYAKNTGNAPIKLRVFWENYGDIGGAEIALGAGESKVFTCTVAGGTTTGCCVNMKLLEAIGDEDVTFEMYTTYKAYYGEITGISVGDGCQKTTFTVGDTFSSSGIRCKVASGYGSEGNCRIVNVTTDFDGRTFTEEDIGKHTVTVTWNGLTTTYEINVVAAE